MNKIILLVVIYNKEIQESETINSLLSSEIHNIKIIIHNNGPKEIFVDDALRDKFINNDWDFELINSLSNKPLSIIYNEFINSNKGFDIYSFLDDDTKISHEYVNQLMHQDSDVELPKIFSKIDSKQYYPLVNGEVYNSYGIITNGNVFSIGSGLTVSQGLISKFRKNNTKLFDEHYALYGVDFSFFRRVILLRKKGEVFSITSNSLLMHSLSKVEAIQSKFRRQERLIDFVLTVRHYPTFRLYLSLMKRILIELKFKRIEDLKLLLKTFISGKHFRCIK
nr:glycosyl transferase [uncultured Erwinia sp.]